MSRYGSGFLHTNRGFEFLNALPWMNQTPFNANGASDLVWTAPTSPFAGNAVNMTGFATKNFVYALGGNPDNKLYSAPINSDGSIGTWAQLTGNSLPVTQAAAKTIVTKGYVYVLSGKFGGTVTGAMYYAKINADGTLGAWQTSANSLPTGVYRGQIFVNHPYVYHVGGFNNSDVAQSVAYRATIAQDGTIGAWSSTTALPAAYGDGYAITTSSRVYLIGGSNNGSGNLTNWNFANLNPDGSLGAWTTFAAPAGKSNPIVFATKNFVFVHGGLNSSFVAQSTGFKAPINSDGSLGAWTSCTAGPTAMYIGLGVIATSAKVIVVGASSDTGTTLKWFEVTLSGGVNDYTAEGYSWRRMLAEDRPVFVSQSFVSNPGSGTSIAVSMPSSVFPGDLLLVTLSSDSAGGAGSFTGPAGWTSGTTNGGAADQGGRTCLAWKIADGSEAGQSYTFTWATSIDVIIQCLQYRNVDPTYPIIQGYGALTTALGSATSRTAKTTWLLVDNHIVGGAFMATPTPWTLRAQGGAGGNAEHVYDVRMARFSGQNWPGFLDSSGATAYQTLLLELTKAKNVQARKTASAQNNAATTTTTYTALAVGAAGANRTVFAALCNSGQQIPTGVTIGGVAATKVDGWIDTGFIGYSLWYANVPTGTTADVVVTCAGSPTTMCVMLHTTYASFNPTPTYSNHAIRGGTAGADAFTFTPTTDGSLVLAFDAEGSAAPAISGSIFSDGTVGGTSSTLTGGHNTAAATSQTVNYASASARGIRAVYCFAPA